MIRFFEEYMGSYNPFEDRGCDEQRILRNSLYAVLELTQKQRLCFEMFYIDKKNQKEIASILRLSQPTVSRHIKSAEAIIEKIGSYCIFSISKTNEQWINLQ